MKSTFIKFTVLAITLLVSVGVQADGRFDRGVHKGSDWRLGERVRDGYAIYRRDGRGWHRVPGSAIKVADGWVLGSRRESGGFAIFRWNGRGWDQAPGGAVEIGGHYSRPWVVNDRGHRFVWNGLDWSRDRNFRPVNERRRDGAFDYRRNNRDQQYRDRDRVRHGGFERRRRGFSWGQRKQYLRRGRRSSGW